MKHVIETTFFAAILMLAAPCAIAQTSDYQVKQNFETSYAELKSSMQNAMAVNEMDSLMNELSNLKFEYENHERILDHALYPKTFDGSIKELKKYAQNAELKLLIIESQNEKISQILNELSSYKSEIANINSRTDSLRQAIYASEKSESQLSELVEQYRKNIQERDEFVLKMVDSLFITYKEFEGESFSELSEKMKTRTLENEENPLKVIQSIIEQNIQILKTDSGSLQTEDFLRMYVVQSRFTEVWNQIGEDLTSVYGGNNAGKWKAGIEDKLGDWKASASKNMWASMDTYLEQNNVDLGAFDNNESFYSAIEAFISSATDSSRDKVVTNESYEDFEIFYDFWNGKIKSDWGKFVQEGEVLTMSQISTIDSEMMSWRDEAKPKTFLIPILLGLSLLTIVGLIIALARK